MRGTPRFLLSLTLLAIFAMALGLPHHALAVIRLAQSNTVSLTNGLVGYWTFDGPVTNWATGQTKDISGNGNDGSLALMSTTSSPTPGKIGQAFNFNGSTNLINMGNVLHPTGAFTYSAWIYQTNQNPTDGAPTIMGRYEDVHKETWFGINGTGGTPLHLELYDSSQDNYIGRDYSGTLSPKTWYHVVAVYDGALTDSSIKLYLNGVRVDDVNGGFGTFVSLANTASIFSIGAGGDGSYPFAGKIDDARVYNRALSATEIKQLYNLGTAKIGHSNVAISNGLVGYWTFDGQDTNWATGKTSDLSGQGNAGQLRSMSTSTSVVSGKIGQSFKFDGTSGYVDLGDVSAGDFGTSDFSIMFWYKAPPGTDGYFLNKRGACGHANFWNIYVTGGTGSIGLEYDEDAVGTNYGSIDPGDVSVNDNKWHHMIFTRKGSLFAEFLDGKLIAYDDPGFITNLSNSASLYIGGNNPCNGLLAASLDDLRIYNRALSASEVKQLYNLGTAKIGHSNVAISNGLVGYWTFDGGSIDWHTNTVSDMSGQGNTGTLVSMSTTSSPTPGKIGQAFKFNGTTNLINMGNVLHPTGAFTYSAWIYQTNQNPVGSAPTIMGKYNDSVSETSFVINGVGGTPLALYVYGTIDNFNFLGRTYSGSLSLNTWYNVVGVYDGGSTIDSIKLYMNGVRVDNGTDSGGTFDSIPNTAAPFIIGATDPPNYYFAGKIDDVRVYNRALSGTEVKQLYNAGR